MIPSLITILAAWFVLGTSAGQDIIRNFTNDEKAVLQAPVDVAIKGWLIVAGVTAGLGLLIWYSESKLSQHQGTGPLLPSAEPVRVAPGPSFGASGGTSVAAGPVRVGGGVNSGGGQSGIPEYASSGGGSGLPVRSEARGTRKAREAAERASVANNRLSEARANAELRKGFGA